MKILHDKGSRVFYMTSPSGERVARLDYIITQDVMDIKHTYVDEHIRASGIGRYLVEMAAVYAKQHKLKIDASCSYADKVIKQYHPELALKPVLF